MRSTDGGAATVGLSELIAPVDATTFLAEYWERKPLHVARALPGWCRSFPGVGDVDELVMLTANGRGSVRLVRTEESGRREAWLPVDEGIEAMLTELYRGYADGWTVVVNGVHRLNGSVARLAAALTDALSHDVGVNVYFTPPSAQGFSAHADGHDVFLLQIAGRKSWRVYPPVIRLPLEDQHVPVEAEDLRVCLLEATVEPGHVLYIPRGFLHEGLAEDRASFHLTIGIHPVRMADIVREAVEIAAERDERLRESVPLQAFAHGSFSPQLATKLVEILAALGQADVAQETLTLLGDRKVADSRPAPDSHFAAIDAARSLGLNTVVRRRHGLDCTVRSADGRATIDFGFNSVVGPDSIREALGYISSNVEFRVAELPDELSDQSKIVLARRLIHEGLLTTNGRPNSKGAR